MSRCLGILILLSLSACASLPPQVNASPSPCAIAEASYECQIERYQNVNAN